MCLFYCKLCCYQHPHSLIIKCKFENFIKIFAIGFIRSILNRRTAAIIILCEQKHLFTFLAFFSHLFNKNLPSTFATFTKHTHAWWCIYVVIQTKTQIATSMRNEKKHIIVHSLKFIMFIIYIRLFTFYNIISNFNLFN